MHKLIGALALVGLTTTLAINVIPTWAEPDVPVTYWYVDVNLENGPRWVGHVVFPDRTETFVDGGTAETRRTGETGEVRFDQGEAVASVDITLDDGKAARMCAALIVPLGGTVRNGVVNGRFWDYALPECVFQARPTTPAAAAPAPAEPTTPGICVSAGQESWGPSIIEAPIGGKPSVVKLDTGHKFVLGSIGQCWGFPGQQALNDRFPHHQREFLARETNGQVLFNPGGSPLPTAGRFPTSVGEAAAAFGVAGERSSDVSQWEACVGESACWHLKDGRTSAVLVPQGTSYEGWNGQKGLRGDGETLQILSGVTIRPSG